MQDRGFFAPATTNATCAATLRMTGVSVMRQAPNRLTSYAITQRVCSWRAAVPGKSEAVWPSSPRPNRTRSKRAGEDSPKKLHRTCSYSTAACSGGISPRMWWMFPGGMGRWSSRLSRAIGNYCPHGPAVHSVRRPKRHTQCSSPAGWKIPQPCVGTYPWGLTRLIRPR